MKLCLFKTYAALLRFYFSLAKTLKSLINFFVNWGAENPPGEFPQLIPPGEFPLGLGLGIHQGNFSGGNSPRTL